MRKQLAIFILLCASAMAQFGSRTATGIITGNPKPSTCNIGQVWVDNTAAPAVLNLCTAVNTWTATTTSASVSGTTGTVAKFTASNAVGNSTLSYPSASVLQLDNSTNPQAFNIYNTDDGAGNTEFAGLTWGAVANEFTIQATKTGSGTLRNISLSPGGGVVFLPSAGALRIEGANPGATYFLDLGGVTFRDSNGATGGSINVPAILTPSVTGNTTNTATVIQSGIDAATTGATASMTVRGENVTAGGANNLAGGALILAAGIGTGTSTPATVAIKSSALGLAAASTQNALVTRYITHVKAGSTSTGTPTTIFNIASATNTAWGVKITVHVDLISSTPNVCGTTEEFSLTGTNNNGAFGTVNIVTNAAVTSTLCSAGTLTLAVTATAANPSVVSVTPSWTTITSITSATITVQIQNVSQQEITLL